MYTHADIFRYQKNRYKVRIYKEVFICTERFLFILSLTFAICFQQYLISRIIYNDKSIIKKIYKI